MLAGQSTQLRQSVDDGTLQRCLRGKACTQCGAQRRECLLFGIGHQRQRLPAAIQFADLIGHQGGLGGQPLGIGDAGGRQRQQLALGIELIESRLHQLGDAPVGVARGRQHLLQGGH